ncbi:SCP-like protein [Ancylostoma duodenale]|uniref:SCP-like protein n=1 Tax=Ancylostoma duodenale TaxID=51022 RepID=A0A0C2D614_9BILA|nr:SCP-like protein [Ancylostoma duodenale]
MEKSDQFISLLLSPQQYRQLINGNMPADNAGVMNLGEALNPGVADEKWHIDNKVLLGILVVSEAASPGCANSEITEEIRNLFLKFHNDARRRVAKGVEPNKQGKLNPAKNMNKLSWNCEMEKRAQDHIKTCSGGLINFGSWGANTMSGYMTGMTLYETGQACTGCSKGAPCDDGLCVKPKEAPDDGKSDQCPADSGLTDKIRNKILDVHNELRQKYDCSLEKLASAHAKKCQYGHSSPNTRRGIGENIYATTNNQADKLKEAESASRLWFGELAKYGVGQENVFTMALANRPGKPVGHYTQMVWQKTSAIGCGIVNCPTMTYVWKHAEMASSTKKETHAPSVPRETSALKPRRSSVFFEKLL